MSDEKILNGVKFGGKDICKRYGKNRVLENVCFAVPSGGIVGIFGLNGSGKTTLLRILSGLDGDFSGVLYKTDFEDVAYMPVDRLYPPEMRVKDLIRFYSVFLEGQRTQEIERELNAAGIRLRSFMSSLSSGMRQYVKFLITVYSGASVCLFDEPMANLDVNLRERIAQIMIKEIDKDRLFVVTTHEIREIERLIDGFYILKKNRLSEYYPSDEAVESSGLSVEEFYKEKVNEKD